MRLIVTTAMVAALTGCSIFRDVGQVESRSFAASGFDEVRVGGSDTVKIVRGPTAGVVARGPAKLLDSLEIRTEGRKLRVGRKSSMGMGWATNQDVVITVTLPALHAAELAGSGDVSIDRADGAEFGANLSGSGMLNIAVIAAASTKLGLRGSGTIKARGQTGALSADLVGSGDLKAEDLQADSAAIAVKGSGSARAFARKSASRTLTGSGDATIKGTRECAIMSRGSGNARCTG